MNDEITHSTETVTTQAVKKFAELVNDGVPAPQAAAEVGQTLSSLKRQGALGYAVQQIVERAKNERLLEKDTEEKVARVRRLELMLQDEDPRVAASMVKSTLDVKPNVAIQINNTALLADPAVRESLESLQIDIEGEEEK